MYSISCSNYNREFPSIPELIQDLMDCGIGYCYYLIYDGEILDVELDYLIGTQYRDLDI